MTLPYGFGSFDRVCFRLINQVWTSRFLDVVMPAVTDLHKVKWFAWGVVPAAVAFWLYKGRKNAARVLVVLVLAVGACDLLSYRVIKPYVARPRPAAAGIGAIERSPSSGYGFPSNHATNMGAAAAVLGVAYPPYAWLFWAVAGIVAWSRVYCGAHYPGDVLGGLVVGGVLSYLWAVLMLGSTAAGAAKKKKKR